MQKKTINEAQFNEQKFAMHHLFREENERVFVLRLKPEQRMSEHKHPGHHLYLLVYEGEGTFLINGEAYPCRQGDVYSVWPDEEFGVRNDSDGELSVYAFMSKQL